MPMDRKLRQALLRRGLSETASEADAQQWYAMLSLEEKGRIGVELGQEAYGADDEPLQTRNDDVLELELTTRSIQLRAQTANEQERSIEAVIATDTPVEVWDWRRGERIMEVLLPSGAAIPQQLPLLATHDRWSLDSVLGSARNLRADGGSISAKLFFAKGDEDADKAWNKSRQGHLTDVSVGYRVYESVEIQPEQTATVSGRQFTAGKLALRIATRWTPKEVSLVPIGADQAAKMRQAANHLF
ncbi:hypothetical protein LCGC14_1671750, partial [marine sediment metagenome]